MMTTKYKILQDTNVKLIKQQIKHFLSNGWSLQGKILEGKNSYAQVIEKDIISSMNTFGYDTAVEKGNQYKREELRKPEMMDIKAVLEKYQFSKENMLVLDFEGVQSCPSWQFNPKVQPYIKNINYILSDCWAVYLYLIQKEDNFYGKTPLQMLEAGLHEKVIEFTHSYYEEFYR